MTFGGYLLSAMVVLIGLAVLESSAPYMLMPLALAIWLGAALVINRQTGGALAGELDRIANMISGGR